MAGILSPDIPAYICYGIVLLVGMTVARARVNFTLDRYPDRWAFAGTWWIFFAYTALPVVLFWFLDYTSAIHDTSLLAALVVAIGYRQIFAGDIQGITLSGQSALLWRPFETWVARVTRRIDELNTRYQYRFYEEVRFKLASEQASMDQLEALISERTPDPAALQIALAPLKAQVAVVPPVPGARRRLVEALWRELRQQEPEDYGYLLHRRRLIGGWQYWQWLKKGRSRLITAAMVAAFAVIVFAFYTWSGPNRSSGLLKYHQWRFLKSNNTERDYWRSRSYLVGELSRSESSENAAQATARRAAIIAPLINELTFKEITERQAAHILRLIMDVHSPELNPITIPRLIDSLQTENPDVRLRANGILLDLQSTDYPTAPIDKDPFKPLVTWIPKPAETPGQTDRFIQLWKRWWAAASQSGSAPKEQLSIEKDLEKGKAELRGLEFDFDQATLRPESAGVLEETAATLKHHADWLVSIEGHTDSKGSGRHNQLLSERRAAAVRTALIDHVEPRRLTSKGFGGARPIAPNDTEEGRARNRRVELRRLT